MIDTNTVALAGLAALLGVLLWGEVNMYKHTAAMRARRPSSPMRWPDPPPRKDDPHA